VSLHPALIGEEIGGYRLETLLSQGTQGAVYLAVGGDGGEVAVEVLSEELAQDDEVWARVVASVKAAAVLDHPGVVKALSSGLCETGKASGRAYVATHPSGGRSLDEILEERGPLEAGEAVELLVGILDVLIHAHGHGIVHGDLRPRYLRIAPSGAVRVQGFGLAGALTQSDDLLSGSVSERVIYAAPEQSRADDADRRADLYSLGVVAFEMLTGKPPFTAPSALALVRMHRQETPPSMTSSHGQLPAGLESVIKQALAKSPDARHQTASELKKALESLSLTTRRKDDLTTENHPPLAGAVASDFFDTLIGQTIDGEFKVLDKLGQGGMGAVYRARSELLGNDVALKVIHPDLAGHGSARERFLREARVALEFTHPNAIATRSCRQTPEGLLYMTLDLSQGRNLRRILDEEERLTIPRALGFVRQVLLALAEAHPKGIVHRDLKPANLLIELDRDGGELVRVCDFGLAKLLDASGKPKQAPLTGGHVVMGTPLYISPEHAGGRAVDGRTDLYAMGSVLYELVTGETLFDGDPESVLFNQISTQPTPPRAHNSLISEEVERVIWRSLEKNPADRFQTAEEFMEAIDALNLDLEPRSYGRGGRRESGDAFGISDTTLLADPAPTQDTSPPEELDDGPDPVLWAIALIGGSLVLAALAFLLTRA
jgi:serine/threonine protein kinase